MKRFIVIACLCTLMLFAIHTLAQSTADLHVSVKDPKGAAVTNATVTVRDPGRNIERTSKQGDNGEYPFVLLPPGTYTVTVEAQGFAKTVATDVNVTIGQVAQLSVALRIAERMEAVEVSAQTEQVETQRTSVATTITEQRIDNLPINGRNYINFTLTNSQTARDTAPSIGAAPTSGLNIGGQRARADLVNVDGMDYVDNSTNGIRSTVSQDAVQEFQIITNGYAAEYGRASGGVVNIITRSGTNDTHGSLFGYLRNRNIQAPNPFSVPPGSDPAYTRVQAGATLGGALKKDKTFYFLSYEITRRQETGFSTIGQDNYGLQPFDASGIFGAPAGTFNIQATPQQAAFLTAFLPGPAPLGVQAYTFLAGASSGIAINGAYPASFALLPFAPPVPNQLKQFPTSCNPISPNLLCNGLPASFSPLSNEAGNYPVHEGTTVVSARLDHKFTNNNSFMLRSNVSPSTVSGINVQGQNQNFGQNGFSRTSLQQFRDMAITAQDTATLGSNMINEFRFQYSRRGLLFDFNEASPTGPGVASNIAGFAFVGREPYSFIRRTEERFQSMDNFSWIKGKHTFKFGADFNHLPVVADFTVNFGGEYFFSGQTLPIFPAGFPEFNAVQSYGLGLPNEFIQGLGNPHAEFSNNTIGAFVQDSWRIKPNLTLNYGVRYDVEMLPPPPPLSALGQATYNVLGMTNGIPRDSNNIAPRVGLAWDPWGDGKTVVRASYGMFYDHPLLGLQFLAQATDGSGTPQVLIGPGAPCSTIPPPPGSLPPLNATNMFQGILQLPSCVGAVDAAGLTYLPSQQRFNPTPNTPSLFINQAFLGAGFPLPFLPFGYPNSADFQYAYSQQANLTIEHDLGHNFSFSIAYNFVGGRHINRPINANTPRGDFLVANWERAVAAGDPGSPLNNDPNGPLAVSGCGVGPLGPYVPAALVNFFRPTGLNPSLASIPALAPCVAGVAIPLLENLFPNLVNGVPAGAPNGVPMADADVQYANGSSVYHGLTVNLRKRFSQKYEFLASYTWSHAIDDSTDLQAPLTPQDSYNPSADRANSTFDQRHRFVFSGIYQSGRLSGSGFWSKFFSDWTVAPIIEVASGRPFNILSGSGTNYQFEFFTGRPNAVPSGTPTDACGDPVVASSFSPTGFFQLPCFLDADAQAALAASNPALLNGTGPSIAAMEGNIRRNLGYRPYNLFSDLRIARRLRFSERVGLDAMVDIFNLVNKFNVSDVNPLFNAPAGVGSPTAAFDPRQFQFGLRLTF
ncbi:MAG: TonB-dependent receptor [Acidobacteriia bacterium]|nr:TonB-dependent receptor [Terriglobia bacterium]